MRLQLVDDSRLRRPDLGTPQFVGRGIGAFLQFGRLCLGFPQVFEHVGTEILIELEDLQPGLGHLGARARDIGDQLTAFALQARLVTLQLLQTGERDQALCIEIGDAGQLLADIADFIFL